MYPMVASEIPEIGVTVVLMVHLGWALWMISGVILAVAGFRWRSLWKWNRFRVAHLAGLLATATVPLWNRGICPLTNWEWALNADRTNPGAAEPYLARLVRSVLYIDVAPEVITAITALGAAVTLCVFIRHPPWRAAGTSEK